MKVVNDALWKGLQILYFGLMVLDKMQCSCQKRDENGYIRQFKSQILLKDI